MKLKVMFCILMSSFLSASENGKRSYEHFPEAFIVRPIVESATLHCFDLKEVDFIVRNLANKNKNLMDVACVTCTAWMMFCKTSSDCQTDQVKSWIPVAERIMKKVL